MTIRDVFNRVSNQFPNSYGDDQFIDWINDLERSIAEVFRHYNGKEGYRFTNHESMDEEVQLERPEIYVPWVISQICLSNEEYDRYNNHAMIFQARYQDWREEYLRKHLPVNRGTWKL